MKKVKLPNPALLIFGALGAFGIADIINPGFNPVGIMILLLVPVFVAEFLYPQKEIDELYEIVNPEPSLDQQVTGELVGDKPSSEDSA